MVYPVLGNIQSFLLKITIMKKFYQLFIIFFSIAYFAGAQTPPPVLDWQLCLGGSLNDQAKDILPLSDGGYLIVGYSHSNDGDVSGHHGSTDSSDGWAVRLSAAKSIVWQKSMGGTGNDYLKSVIPTSDGNFIAVGGTNSINGDISNFYGSKDIWVVKFNGAGDILWNKCYGGSQADSVGNIIQVADGGYILVGTTESADGNLSGTGSREYTDAWYFKISSTGNYEWGYVLGNSEYDYGEDIRALPDGNYVIAVQAGVDGSGEGYFPVELFTLEPWIIKINSFGTVLWKYATGRKQEFAYSERRFNTSLQVTDYGIAVVDNGYTASGIINYTQDQYFSINLSGFNGTYSGISKVANISREYPEGLQTITLSPHAVVPVYDSSLLITGQWRHLITEYYPYDTSNSRAFLLYKSFKQGVTNDTIVRYFGGSQADAFTSIKRISENEYIIAGHTFSNDGDVSGNHGGSDFWIVKVKDTTSAETPNIIQGIVFLDHNDNNIFDNGDVLFDKAIVKSVKTDNTTISTVPQGGIYSNEADTGTYTTTTIPYLPYYTITPSSAVSTFTGYNQRDTVSFALQPIPGQRDYSVTLVPLTPVDIDREVRYQITYTNHGTDTLVNGVLELLKHPRLTFNSSVPSAYYRLEDTVRWHISTLYPGESATISMLMFALDANEGDTVYVSAYIDSTGDVNAVNNYSALTQITVAVPDPFDIEENNGGTFYTSDLLAGKPLTYTIRFTTSSADPVTSIIVTSELDENLDFNTFEMISSSHDFKLNIEDLKNCRWSFSDHPTGNSHTMSETEISGYITYRIKPKADLKSGSTIDATAFIYLDDDPVIQTRTQRTTIKPLPPSQRPIVSGLLNTYCEMQGMQTVKITNLPAASEEVDITVLLGEHYLSVDGDSTFTFNVNELTGNNEIVVTYSNISGSQSSTHTFEVTPAVIPEVDISADITHITEPGTTVLITAVYTGTGSVTPLYSFAADRSFNHILQTESDVNTLTLDDADLSTGENWIYVKVNIGNTCNISPVAFDSIMIMKTIDPKVPGTIIQGYPNPFEQSVTIRGLDHTKTYILRVHDINGKPVYSGRVIQQNVFTINNLHLPSGTYSIAVYDEKEKKTVKTIKLVKR